MVGTREGEGKRQKGWDSEGSGDGGRRAGTGEGGREGIVEEGGQEGGEEEGKGKGKSRPHGHF